MCLAPFITVKILYFIWFGASTCLLPYLSLHMRILGIQAWEASIISGILPLFQVAACVLVSTFSGYATSYKKTTMWCLLFTTLAASLLLMSPEVPSPVAKNITMQFQCGPDIAPTLIVDKCNEFCDQDGVTFAGNRVNVFFIECHVDCPNKKGTFKNTADLCFSDHHHNRVCHVVEVNNTSSENFTFGISLGNIQNYKDRQCLYAMDGVTWHYSYYQQISCPIILTEASAKCTLICNLQEIVNSNSISIMGSKHCLEGGTKGITYAVWMYSSLRILFQFAYGTSLTMINDGLSHFFKVQRKNRPTYVIWSHIASAVLTPLAGLTLDYRTTAGLGSSSYNWIFFTFVAMTVLTIASLGGLQFDTPSRTSILNTLVNILKLFKEFRIVLLIFCMLLLSTVNGFFDVFLFWHLQDISTPYWVMGLTISIGFFIGAPMLIKTFSYFIGKVGKDNLLIVCLTLQTVRCAGYYFTKNFWWCFLFEFLGATIFHISWKIISMNCKNFLSNNKASSLQVCIGIINYGIGKSCGSFAGGLLMVTCGIEKVFLFFAIICAAFSVVYSILYYGIMRRLPQRLVQCRQRKADVIADAEGSNSAFISEQLSVPEPKFSEHLKLDSQEEQKHELIKLNVSDTN